MAKLHTLLPSLILGLSFLAVPVASAAVEIDFDTAKYESNDDCLYEQLTAEDGLNKADISLAAKQFLAKKKYGKQHAYITTEAEWKTFSNTYLGKAVKSYPDKIEKDPDGYRDENLISYEKKLARPLDCDFGSEQLLVLFAGAKISAVDLLDIAVIPHENRLNFFAFHYGMGAMPLMNTDTNNSDLLGTFYVIKIPREIGQLEPEFRLAYQKYLWDKACSGFYAITAPAAKPNVVPEQGENSQPKSRSEVVTPANNG